MEKATSTSINSKSETETGHSIVVDGDDTTKNDENEIYNIHSAQNGSISRQKSTRKSVLIQKYHKQGSIITVDAQNSILFRIFGNYSVDRNNNDHTSINENANKIYHFILSKKVAVAIIFLICIFIIIDYFAADNGLDIISDVIGWGLLAILSLSYILCLNIDVMLLIAQTFDFWFKIFNFTSVVIAQIILDTSSQPAIVSIMLVIGSMTTAFVIFMFDALHTKNNTIKLCILTLVSLIMLFYSISSYFNEIDKTIYPFGKSHSEYTQISLKNVKNSGLVNVGLFVLKPVISHVYFKLYFYFHDNNQIDINGIHGIRKESNSQEYNLNRSTSVVEKPYFKWNNIPAVPK